MQRRCASRCGSLQGERV